MSSIIESYLSYLTGGWGIWILPGWGGKFESELSSISNENTRDFISNVKVFKGKEVTFTRKIVRR